MPASTTMTIRVSPQVKAKLGRLAANTRRSRSYLAAEAIENYVDRELESVEGIERGLADAEAGRIVPHDQVTAAKCVRQASARAAVEEAVVSSAMRSIGKGSMPLRLALRAAGNALRKDR